MIDSYGVKIGNGDQVLINNKRLYTLMEYENGTFMAKHGRDIYKFDSLIIKTIQKIEPDTMWIQRLFGKQEEQTNGHI